MAITRNGKNVSTYANVTTDRMTVVRTLRSAAAQQEAVKMFFPQLCSGDVWRADVFLRKLS
jgi:hypothetical protein